MDVNDLNSWAATFVDSSKESVDISVSSKLYTSSAGAALVLLYACAKDGKTVTLDIDESNRVEVYCGSASESGSFDELAELITTACYREYHG